MYKIMIVEDDESILKELCVLLTHHHYECCVWNLKEDVEAYITKENPHVILLDINLPNADGFSICSQIRVFSDVPIIFVTSRNTDMDELCSMRMGGDDFITKPYNSSILLARIEAIIKRCYKESEKNMSHQGITLNLALSRIENGEKYEELTKNEVKILYYLFLHKGEIVSREDLIDYLWDNKMFIDDNALSVNITRIRNKLRMLRKEDFIITKHRQGYVI